MYPNCYTITYEDLPSPIRVQHKNGLFVIVVWGVWGVFLYFCKNFQYLYKSRNQHYYQSTHISVKVWVVLHVYFTHVKNHVVNMELFRFFLKFSFPLSRSLPWEMSSVVSGPSHHRDVLKGIGPNSLSSHIESSSQIMYGLYHNLRKNNHTSVKGGKDFILKNRNKINTMSYIVF